MPSGPPTYFPSAVPTVSSMPTDTPTLTQPPTLSPSANPTTTFKPTPHPTSSQPPTVSQLPTPSPTARKVFEEGFSSRDIGLVGREGGSSNPESGLHVVQGSGYDIYGYNDGFHYLYVETSGDVTVTALVENFSASRNWAKTGIMFRDSLSAASSHYSMFLTRSKGVANQYRTCTACSTYHAQSWFYSPSSVWLKVTKVGNVLTAYYRPSTSTSDTWYQFGVSLSMVNIKSTGYYVGIAVTSRTNSGLATAEVSNIQLDRVCTDESVTKLQCEQASNCEVGSLSNTCYYKGTLPSWEGGYPYDGSFVGTVLDTASSVSSFGCDSGPLRLANVLDGTTKKFYCEITSETFGIVATPSHGQISIANGLRLYAANNYPEGDPTEYKIQGRISPGSQIREKWDNLCWKAQTGTDKHVVPAACDVSDSLQLFYYHPETREIRNVGIGPSLCLDVSEGIDTMFLPCSSFRNLQKWTYDSTAQRFSSVGSPGSCLEYNFNTGYVILRSCHGGANQKAYLQEDTWISLATDGDAPAWEDIATGPLELSYERNAWGKSLTSDYESGDVSKNYVEVDFFTNTDVYSEYR